MNEGAMQMAEISTSPNTDSEDCGKPQVRSRQKYESGELFRWCQCFDPKERLTLEDAALSLYFAEFDLLAAVVALDEISFLLS